MRKGERIEVNDRKTNNMALPWEEIIPSPEVRHLIENGTVPLSDTDLATLVCNMQASPKTIRRNLVRIYEMTGDRKLKEQLKTEWEKQDGKSEKLMENGKPATSEDGKWMRSRLDEEELIRNRYVPIPNPYEKGDTVKMLRDGNDIGIVQTSQEEWRHWQEEILSGEAEAKGKYVSFADVEIEVCFTSDEGLTRNQYVNPIYLTKYNNSKQKKEVTTMKLSEIFDVS